MDMIGNYRIVENIHNRFTVEKYCKYNTTKDYFLWFRTIEKEGWLSVDNHGKPYSLENGQWGRMKIPAIFGSLKKAKKFIDKVKVGKIIHAL